MQRQLNTISATFDGYKTERKRVEDNKKKIKPGICLKKTKVQASVTQNNLIFFVFLLRVGIELSY